MKSLFARLLTKLSEQTKLKILLRNVAPFYQAHVSVVEISSVDQLLKVCHRIEERKAAVDSYVPPPRKNQALEPDLACVHADSTPLYSSVTKNKNYFK